MGGLLTKRRPPPPPPPPPKKGKRKREPTIHEYLPKRREPTTFDDSENNEDIADTTETEMLQDNLTNFIEAHGGQFWEPGSAPAWQTKWEKELRPGTAITGDDFRSLSMSSLSNGRVKGHKKRRGGHPLPDLRSRYYGGPFSSRSLPERPYLPDINETENKEPDRRSVTSLAVDRYHWIHKTDARANNYWRHGTRLWPVEPKRGNKFWFLGHDATYAPRMEEGLPPKKSRSYPMIYRKRRVHPQ